MRLLVTLQWSWSAFDGSEVAICLALLSFFIGQSLLGCHPILNNKDKREELRIEIVKYYMLGAALLAIFALIVAFNSIVNDLHFALLKTPLLILQIGTEFVGLPFTVILALKTQETYRLTARLA